MKLDGHEPLSQLRQYCLVARQETLSFPLTLSWEDLDGDGNS